MRNRIVPAAVVVAIALAATGIVLTWRLFGRHLPLRIPGSASCVVQVAADAAAEGAGPAAGPGEDVILDPEQMANASTISAVGIRRNVPRQAIVVALATALQESKLRNLSGGDRDSVGLFQQRPSQGWGTREKIADPRYAAGKFYSRLMKVHGWQQMRVTEAAQAVQRSADPEAYQKWAPDAEVLTQALVGSAPGALACSIAPDPPARGAGAADALATSLRLDWGKKTPSTQAHRTGVSLAVSDARTGWQYAHWLVAHAEERGVKRVRFGNLEWTGRSGKWKRGKAPASATERANANGGRVLADVYPDTRSPS